MYIKCISKRCYIHHKPLKKADIVSTLMATFKDLFLLNVPCRTWCIYVSCNNGTGHLGFGKYGGPNERPLRCPPEINLVCS